MKKTIIAGIAVVATVCLISSCHKENNNEQQSVSKLKSEAIAKVITSTASTKAYGGGGFELIVQVGHQASGCGGCITENGEKIHVNCQGDGNYCDYAVGVVPIFPPNFSPVFKKGEVDKFSLVELYENSLTEEKTFVFPDRSFRIVGSNNENGKNWLNIPAQTLQKDTDTKKFVFNNVYYSDTPEFLNE